MILDKGRYNQIWNWVEDVLHFEPDVDTSVVPFRIPYSYAVYDISQMNSENTDVMDELITGAFLECTVPGERLYALDWQHAGFLYDPRIGEEDGDVFIENPMMPGGGYSPWFPPYYPDGDYYFFIDEKLRFGYLSHPWRREVWIFGNALVEAFERIDRQLGWLKRSGADWKAKG